MSKYIPEGEPLLDGLEQMPLVMKRPCYLKPHVIALEQVSVPEDIISEYLVAQRITLTLGSEVTYSRDTYEERRYARETLRRALARELYGNIEMGLFYLQEALVEEDMLKCRNIVNHLLTLIK